MDTNTQILQELVKAVNSPDWWTIGITSAITIINATIMVWLGWRQYKLQKQQTYAQEYNTYRQLYILISSANNEIDGFLVNLNNALWAPRYNIDKEYLKRQLTHLDRLRKDLSDSYVDYELKFPHEPFNKNGYYQILSLMARIIHQTIISLEKGEVIIAEGTQRIAYPEGDMDKAYAVAIAKHFKDGFLAGALIQNFEMFIEQKQVLRCNDKFLTKIRERCKID